MTALCSLAMYALMSSSDTYTREANETRAQHNGDQTARRSLILCSISGVMNFAEILENIVCLAYAVHTVLTLFRYFQLLAEL